MGESIKSRFKPTYPKKYKGDSKNIICRSSWERRFCNYCDLNENILQWGSEEFWIPYKSPVDKRVHRYFPDFIIKVKEITGQIKTYVIEVKPDKQTRQPKARKRVNTFSADSAHRIFPTLRPCIATFLISSRCMMMAELLFGLIFVTSLILGIISFVA